MTAPFQPALAECQDNEEAEHDGEAEWPQPGGERDRADIADVPEVELEPHHEQQHGDADLRQQVDLVVRRHQREARRPEQDPRHDVGDQNRLAQPHRDRPQHGGDDQEQGRIRQ